MSGPERIWLQMEAGDGGTHTWADHNTAWDEQGVYEPEYVRADIAATEADALRAEIKQLREAIATLIYETTHLSPEESNGSHWCSISKSALYAASAALEETKP